MSKGRSSSSRCNLAALFERQAKGGRRFEVRLFRVDGAMRRIVVGASRPLNDPVKIARLFRERLDAPGEDEFDAGYGVDIMRLSCLVAEPLAPRKKNSNKPMKASASAISPTSSTG